MFGSLRRALSSEEVGGRVSEAGFMGRVFVAVALVALTISYFTTTKGFHSFFANDTQWWAIVIALGFGFVIQAVLAGSSWLLGQDLGQYISRSRDHAPSGRSGTVTVFRVLVTLAMFLPALFLSIFLSFNTYFNSLYHGPEENRLQQARVPPFLSEVIADLKNQVDATRETAVAGLNDKVLGAWLPKLATVADEAAKAEATIQQALKQEADDLRKKINDQQLELLKQNERRKNAERKQIDAKTVLDQDLPAQISVARKTVDELNSRLKELQAKRDPLARRLYAYVKNRDGTMRRVKVSKVARELVPIDKELGATRTSIQANEQNIRTWEDKNKKANTQLADAVSELAVGEGPVKTAVPQKTDNWHDVATAVTSLRRLKTDLELKTAPKGVGGAEALYNEAVNTCNVLIKVLRNKPDTAKRVDGIACDPQALATIQRFDQQERFRKQFDAECYSIDRNQPRTFDAALEQARKCRSIAQNGGLTDIVATNRIIREFEESFSTDRSQFSKTMSAFSLSFQMALLALVASLVQDLVLLGASIFVEITRWQRRHEEMSEQLVGEADLTLRPGEDAATQCAKVVLGNVRPTSDVPTLYAFDTNTDAFEKLTPGQQANVRSGITGLVQQGLARVPPHSSGRGSIVHLTSSGLFELRRILRSRMPAVSGQKRHQIADEPERRRSARSSDQVEPVGRSDSRNRTMGLRFAQGESGQRRRPLGFARDTTAGAARTIQIFTPAELWRLDRSSVIPLKRASDGLGAIRMPNVNSEIGSGFDGPDSNPGFQADDADPDRSNAEQSFAGSAESNPHGDGYENQRGDSYDTSSGREHTEQDAERNRRRSARTDENRGDKAFRSESGDFAANAGRGPSLDELREMAREGRRK